MITVADIVRDLQTLGTYTHTHCPEVLRKLTPRDRRIVAALCMGLANEYGHGRCIAVKPEQDETEDDDDSSPSGL